jgi:3-hydroxy-9,10-secoandrosta-1,3,5(10)-triene-9,17-dione monooxygenase
MLPETVHELVYSGLFGLLRPARYGGGEADPRVFFDVQRTLARACPSTAWVYGVVGVHAWQLALFEARAQDEVWGDAPEALISSSYAPVGKVEVVPGGYRLSGRWSFSSGSQVCQWVFLGAPVPTEGGPPDVRTFLLPRADYQIVDVWHTTGLTGTGSQDVVVEGAFVPEHRTHRFRDGFLCNSPGNAVNRAPCYALPFGQVFVRSVSTTAIGIAEGALEAFVASQRDRKNMADGTWMRDDPSVQELVGACAAEIHGIKAVMSADLAELTRAANERRVVPIEDRVRMRFASADAVVRATAVVDRLYTAAGGRALFPDHPLNRYFRDAHAARAHYANGPDRPVRNLGRVLMGGKTMDYFL